MSFRPNAPVLFDAPSPPPSSSHSESSHTESDIDEELEKDRATLKEQIVVTVQRQVAAERIAAAAAAAARAACASDRPLDVARAAACTTESGQSDFCNSASQRWSDYSDDDSGDFVPSGGSVVADHAPGPARHSDYIPRASAVASARRTHELLNPSHMNCYPPVASSVPFGETRQLQLYRSSGDSAESDYQLNVNCQLLHVQCNLSQIRSNGEAGLGLFAAKSFAEGETIGYLWGKFVSEEQWQSIVERRLDPTAEQPPGFSEDYVTPASRGIFRCIAVPQQDSGADRLLGSEQCPMSYINHGHGEGSDNVKIVVPNEPYSIAHGYKYIRFVAIKPISCSEELTTTYGWSQQTWMKAQTRYIEYSRDLAKLKALKGWGMRGMDDMRAQGIDLRINAFSAAQQGRKKNATEAADRFKSMPLLNDGSSGSSLSSESDSSFAVKRRREALERTTRTYQPLKFIKDQEHERTQYACCKKACQTLIPSNVVTTLRNRWSALSSAEQVLFTNRNCSVKSENPANNRMRHIYRVPVPLPDDRIAQVGVCKQFWCDLYGVNHMYHQRCLHSIPGVPLERQRGNFKRLSVIRWLKKMAACHEQMPDAVGSGKPQRKLSSHPLTAISGERRSGVMLSYAFRQQVYEDYVQDTKSQIQSDLAVVAESEKFKAPGAAHKVFADGTGCIAGRSHFFKTWKNFFPNIKLRKHNRFAKCDECVDLRSKIFDPKNRNKDTEMGLWKAAHHQHLQHIYSERHVYHNKRSEAVRSKNDVLSIIFDGADQGAYG